MASCYGPEGLYIDYSIATGQPREFAWRGHTYLYSGGSDEGWEKKLKEAGEAYDLLGPDERGLYRAWADWLNRQTL